MTSSRPLTWRRAVRYWREGRHAEIPVCCRAWFEVRMLLRIPGWPGYIRFLDWRYDRWEARRPGSWPDYVRCPACQTRRRVVQIHYCDPSCGWERDGLPLSRARDARSSDLGEDQAIIESCAAKIAAAWAIPTSNLDRSSPPPWDLTHPTIGRRP